MPSPLTYLVACAVIIGGLSSFIVIISISFDGWQEVYFNENKINSINATGQLSIYKMSSSQQFYRVLQDNGDNSSSEFWIHSSTSGLWRTCDNLSDDERKLESPDTVTQSRCFVFVIDFNEDSTSMTSKGKQVSRLHNSAASCYIVVLIDLSSATILGIIGLLKKQVASCMVTGVLYSMAALFGVFGLSMFHTKHYYEKYQCYSLDRFPDALCSARHVDTLYAIPLAWFGVILCIMAALLWLVLARVLRVIIAKTMA